MKLPRRQLLHLAAGAAALPIISRIARAQTYPSRPVRIVVAASTAAFSVASRLSNSSDILLADIFRAAPTTVGRLVRAPGSKF